MTTAQGARLVMRAAEHRAAVVQRTPLAPARSRATPTVASLAGARISSPGDRAEREAESVARQVAAMPAATESAQARRFTGLIPATPTIARQAEGESAAVTDSLGIGGDAGQALPQGVRRFMEPRFGADFSAVRLHTGTSAARASRRLNAAAFTIGHEVFFGEGRFQPETDSGRELIAHELTHTIQQGTAAQPAPAIRRSLDVPAVHVHGAPAAQRLGVADAVSFFAERANQLRGFRMLTLLLGRNPITGQPVQRSAPELLRALVELLPGGAMLLEALVNQGIVARVAGWAQQRLSALAGMAGSVRQGIADFIDGVSWTDAFDLGGLWDRARRIVTEPIAGILDFGRSLVDDIVGFIRQAILPPLAQLAQGLPAYPLLRAVLGSDPITGEAVARTPEALIGGFMTLIGRPEVWLDIQRANAVDRAWAWYQSASGDLRALVHDVPLRFATALRVLQPIDIVLVPRAFVRLAGVFTRLVGAFMIWGAGAVWGLLEIIIAVVAPDVLPYLRHAGPALRMILRDPIGFARNFVRAAVAGLRQFALRVATHLRATLVGWLTTTLGGSGVHLPQSLAPREILAFVASALGVTWARLRGRLVRMVGEPAVRAIEVGFDLVRALVVQGPVAAWALMQANLQNLRELTIEQLVRFVATDVVHAAVECLLEGLHEATGGFIQAIVAIRNVIGFFVERMREMVEVTAAAVGSIAAVAAGAIRVAADRIEQVLVGVLTRAIAFMARVLALGRVADAVLNIVRRVGALIERALDGVLHWIVTASRRVATAAGIAVGAARTFRTREGSVVELPADLTLEDATRLETEGTVAASRIGRRAPPQPVPAIEPRGRRTATARHPAVARLQRGAAVQGEGRAVPGARMLGAMLTQGVGAGKVAQYLAAKGLPALVRGVGRLHTLKSHEQTHDDAARKRAQSEQAVRVPTSDEQSKGNAGQVGAVEAKRTPVVDAAKPRQRLQDSLAENIPRTLEDVDNFKHDMKAQHMGADVMQVVHGDKDAVLAKFGDLRTTPPPVPSGHTPQDLPPIETAPATAGMNLGAGAIAPLRKDDLDVGQYSRDADQRLKEEGVSQEQLDMVDSGELAEAKREKLGLEKSTVTEPALAQKFAQTQASELDTGLRAREVQERAALHSNRRTGLGATAKRQGDARTALERKREAVASQINDRYETAQRSVKRKLAELETSSLQRFDKGNVAAAGKFESQVNLELEAYKDDRYSGFFGRLRKAKDWLLGMDDLPRVKQIFESNRTIFVNTINALVETISADNKRVIQECKDELESTGTAIREFVAGLEPGLRGVGEKAAQEMGEKLQALDNFVAAKERDLRQQLQDKQQAAIKAIDEKIEKMKEAMAGALAKLGKLLLWAAKKFFTWALGKFGYSLSDIEAIISKGVAVLKAIFTQPIQFVKNLVRAAKEGFQSFAKNFVEHLKDALFEWLTGSLTGIRLPEVWNARGIAGLVMQILNVTAGSVRQKLVDRLGGEAFVARLEARVAVVKAVLTEGPQAAWDQIKEMGEALKNQVVAQLEQFVAIEIVKRAAQTIAMLFVPGAGIVRAIIGIYDTVVFFIQKARDIARMVGSFLGSIAEIAAGNIAGAAQALEGGLARALKLVIEFLARFLKLSGIPQKIQGVLEKVRSRVDAVVDRVLDWIVGLGKRVITGAATGARAVAGRISEWWTARKSFTASDRSRHTLSFRGGGTSATLMVESTPTPVADFLKDIRAAATSPAASSTVQSAFAAAWTKMRLIDRIRSRVETGPAPRQPSEIDLLNAEMEQLANLLAPLIPLKFPAPPVAPAGAPVAPGQLIKLTRINLVALVTSIDAVSLPGVQMVMFRVVSPRHERSIAPLPRGFTAAAFGKEYTLYVDDPRELYLGATPDKASSVGAQVRARMQEEGTFDPVNDQVLYKRDGRRYPLAECDMGHVIDAVTWWNSNGRLTGARSSAVDNFMKDSGNYEFEPGSENRRRGAALAARGIRYLPPVV